jgi:hypothetical protein
VTHTRTIHRGHGNPHVYGHGYGHSNNHVRVYGVNSGSSCNRSSSRRSHHGSWFSFSF